MPSERIGHIVWHDLFTHDPISSRSFYEKVAGWRFVIEQATDFAWGGGEQEFVLALLGDEAGAGIVGYNDVQAYGWVPYVEVQDVDSIAQTAEDLHGVVVKAPFEVPGVGRNCLLRDPRGTLLGVCMSRHNFPVPTRQFGSEAYQIRTGEFPVDFYYGLFNWSALPPDHSKKKDLAITRAGVRVGFRTESTTNSDRRPCWIPSLRVGQLCEALDQVQSQNGTIVEQTKGKTFKMGRALILDPAGVPSYIVAG